VIKESVQTSQARKTRKAALITVQATDGVVPRLEIVAWLRKMEMLLAARTKYASTRIAPRSGRSALIPMNVNGEFVHPR
jgi:hypothetical protein